MFTVNELANRVATPAHVVRYYARIGLLKPKRHPENDYRLFGKDDAERLRFIRMAKQLGFTLCEIRNITERADRGESPCVQVRKIIQHRIQENRVKIDAMINLQNRMKHALKLWESLPNGTPDDRHICHLIESCKGEVDEIFEKPADVELN